MIQVLIVDDHKIVREGLNAIINYEKDINVAGECIDGTEVLDFVKNHNIDVILMDIIMQHQNGISTTRQVKVNYPNIKVMALSMQSDYSSIQKMLNAGASGYAVKGSGANEIIKAIKQVYNGNRYFSKEVSNNIMLNMVGKEFKMEKNSVSIAHDKLQNLTAREIEILKHIASEETNNEIAENLNISSGTVSTHRRNLLQKMNVKNSIGLVKFAYQCGLV
jgi:DNA-binding NarL/FixJ family response regulator